ncbi:sensor histidine kinase [Streptomyces sp. NPDC001985]|uniref:sensor histidine kinase n=1 Tax=Streptomyces sp. NPDC001985 TaxID=3154406 RepID=UPI0033317011
MLGFSLLLALATGEVVGMGRADWYATGALVAAALALDIRRGGGGRVPPGRTAPCRADAVHYGVRWAIASALTWLNPFFAFYASVGYLGADRLLPRPLLWPGLAATAITLAGAQSGGLPPKGAVGWAAFGALFVFNLVLVSVMGHLEEKETERSSAQAATIAELERTNTALQEALDENAALHTQLVLQAREAGIADERRRVAAEIHDTLAQGLTGIIAQLRVVAGASDPERAREHLDRATELARYSLGEARRSVHDLAPSDLDDATLPEALRRTVAAWSRRTGVAAGFTVTGTAEPLHDEIAGTLLRIAGEALANAARHSGASRAGVTLSFMDGEVTLDVRDDGRGFDPLDPPARTRSGGFGLAGMRARAERVAGEVTVESEPGGGTAVSARVPLVRHDH